MATTSNQLTFPYCSSSSSSSLPSWDVFLSFYGKDTRRNFTSHLYSALVQAGIQTFMDEPELQKGQEISQGLVKAIHGSKIFVVVLSKNYASSRWCLDELVEILTCYRTNGQVVIPVFYYVDPSDLRHHKGSFGDALDFHKKRYSVDIIETWKSALADIAELSGHHLKTDTNDKNESDIVQEIVEELTPLISTKTLHLEEYLLGIDSSVEEIYQKLSMESNDVRAVGICGMGGIGKTTTATAFYNKYSNNFDISCFVDDVKQHSQGGSPLLPLLNQLLIKFLRRKDYKVPDVVNGIRKLKQILSSKKALIVLDDLDQSSYSEFLARLCNLFSAGSRIIFTARDTNLVNQLKEDIPGVDIYMMRKLEHIDSLELFSYHAFRKPEPPESFRELTVSFVTYAGGLPLAVKVLGSSLRGRTHVSFWEDKLEKVCKIPDKEIQKILQLSYDELDDETHKAIFLDVAFFFVGKDKDEAVHIFKSCGYFPDAGIPVLVERCLLTIDKNNMFRMHNLIQDMGREVIREGSKHGNCRHLYLREGNACVALQNLEGTEKIEGLIICQTMSTKRHLSAKIFERLPNLRLLEIIGAHDITGDFENSFHELRCIRWYHCPWTHLPSSFRPQKLASLNMPSSKLKKLWKGATPSVNLKTIDLSYSMNLKTTPDFRDSRLIEKLKFCGCKSLLKVHPSIGQLTSLSHLDLDGCEKLKELPEPVRQLSKLGHLDLHGCVNLKRLPESIKQLTNLGSLNLRRCRNLKRLPDQLGDMKGLKMLDASYTAIEQLPDSIVLLKDLVELNLYKCKKIRKLPDQIGNMEGLKTFNAGYTAIKHLPDTFVGLANLVNLHLGWCKNLASLPNSLWKLKFLRVLELDGIIKLKQLPGQLGKMQCLEKLTAFGTSIEELPDSIGLLSRLQVLDLWCNKIKYLPNVIWNLTSLAKLSLCRTDIDGIVLPDTVKDMKLKSLCLWWCNISSWMPVILSLSSLEELNLSDVDRSFSSSGSYSLSKLSNLRALTLQNCTSLDCLPDLSSLKQLNKLYIFRCISLQSLPPLPPHLKQLTVNGCTSLQDVPDLSMLKELEYLRFSGCSNLKSISLKQSFLQVTSKNYPYFGAELPNTEIPEWFSYKSSGSTVSFDIPPNLGENFFGVALWIVYKYTDWRSYDSYMRAVITNRTKGTKKDHDICLQYNNRVVGVVQSRVESIWEGGISSGDRIKVSFQSLLYYYDDDIGGIVPGGGEAKVMMCGAHLLLKTPSPPY